MRRGIFPSRGGSIFGAKVLGKEEQLRLRRRSSAGFRGKIVDQFRPMARPVALHDESLAVGSNLVQLSVMFFREDIAHASLQIFVAHREIVDTPEKTQFFQRLLDFIIRNKESASGGNLKMLGDGISKNRAVREGGPVLPYPPGEGAPNPAVASVVVLTVVTGMQLANDPMETAFHQAVQSLAHGVCLAHGPTQKERVPRLGVGSERKIGGCRVGQPDHPPDLCYFGEVLGKAIGISRKNCIA
jgi:hypothetical protein